MAHKESSEEVKGKMRINNGFLQSAIKHVTILVTGSTPAKEIVKLALIKFDMEVVPPCVWGVWGEPVTVCSAGGET